MITRPLHRRITASVTGVLAAAAVAAAFIISPVHTPELVEPAPKVAAPISTPTVPETPVAVVNPTVNVTLPSAASNSRTETPVTEPTPVTVQTPSEPTTPTPTPDPTPSPNLVTDITQAVEKAVNIIPSTLQNVVGDLPTPTALAAQVHVP